MYLLLGYAQSKHDLKLVFQLDSFSSRLTLFTTEFGDIVLDLPLYRGERGAVFCRCIFHLFLVVIFEVLAESSYVLNKLVRACFYGHSCAVKS